MIINFEHIVGKGPAVAVPDGYKGLNYHNVEVFQAAGEPIGSGYQNDLTSGRAVAFNGYANPCWISSDVQFNFLGGEFAAAWDNDLKLMVRGYRDGELVARHSYVLDRQHTHIDASGFDHIDRLVFSTKGGVDADPDDSGSGSHFVMDDLHLGFGGAPSTAQLDYDAAMVESQAMGDLAGHPDGLVI